MPAPAAVERAALPRLYGDVLDVWRPWAEQVTGRGLDSTLFWSRTNPRRLPCSSGHYSPASHRFTLTTLQSRRKVHHDNGYQFIEAADALAANLKRTEIQRHNSSIPGRIIVQVLTEIPGGLSSGWHTHPGEEVGYIVQGSVQMEIEGRPTLLLKAGDGFLIPPGVPHNALDLGPGVGEMLSTYLVDPDEPLASFTH